MSIVKSFSVGDGDMFYIRHNSDNFTIIDCCMCEDNRAWIVDELKDRSEDKGVTRFISTHPDDDHLMGLAYLHKEMSVRNFYCVKNEATKEDQTDDFDQYCELRDDATRAFYLYRGCSRKWMNLNSDQHDRVERGNSGIHILWPITSNDKYRKELTQTKNGGSPNNISVIVKYSLNEGASVMWMGDLETDFMDDIKDEITMAATDILFAPHHGRDMVPVEWLDRMQPRLIIIGEAPSKYLNYYDGYDTITQNSAGDITLECVPGKTHIYVSDEDYYVDFLENEQVSDTHGNYIGTLKVADRTGGPS